MSFATRRSALDSQYVQLKNIRTGQWDPTVKDICAHVLPYRIQLEPTMINRGERRDRALYTSAPIRARRTLDAGMMAGVTSPVREWAKIGPEDPELGEDPEVKMFMDILEMRVFAFLAASNWYKELSNAVYPDLSGPATGAVFQEESAQGQMYFRSMVWGEYVLGVNAAGEVDKCFRELGMTVRQMVQMFGRDRCSQTVKNAWDGGHYDKVHVVHHAVFPNEDFHAGLINGGRYVSPTDNFEEDEEFFDPDSFVSNSKMFKSCWWEAVSDGDDKFLRISGYDYFPVLAPRWSSTASDAYGRGPGWDALPDCKSLQHDTRSYMQLIDLAKKPPLKVTGEVRKASLIPGAITVMGNEAARSSMVEAIIKVQPGILDALKARIDDVEGAIREGYYNHLWQMLTLDDRAERPTATEVDARRSEVALMLGPLLESLNPELLKPAIENTIRILERSDRLPPIPPKLQGQPLKLKFISIMHQAQQAQGLGAVQTFMSEVGAIHQMFPQVLDKVDHDVVINELQKITGVKPDMVRQQKVVDEIRAERAAKEQAMQEGQAMLGATEGVKNLRGADADNLSQLMGSLGPIAEAQSNVVQGI